MICVVSMIWAVVAAGQGTASTEITGWSNAKVAARAFAITAQHCSPCHSGRPGAPFSLRKPADLVRYARGMAGEVLSERMPPGSARSDFGDFLRHGALMPQDVSVLWEWSNRNEIGADGKSKMSSSDFPAALPPIPLGSVAAPTWSVSRTWQIPAEAPNGLVRLTSNIAIPAGRVNQPFVGFDIDSTTTARLIRVMLMDPISGQMIAAAGPASRGAKLGSNGPRLPANVKLIVEASVSGEPAEVAVRCYFWWGAKSTENTTPAPARAPFSRVDGFRRSGTKVTVLTKPVRLTGVYPDFGARAEAWSARVWTAANGWKLVAEVRSATSKSAGVFNLERALELPAGSKIESRVQYRRGASGSGRLYRIVQENF